MIHGSSTDSNITTGILMPQLKHQWKLTLKSPELTQNECEMVSRQVTGCTFNNTTKSISMVIEQDAYSTYLFDVVNKLGASDIVMDIKIEMLGGKEGTNGVNNTLRFTGCTLQHHVFNLDYASSDAAAQHMVFKYDVMNVG